MSRRSPSPAPRRRFAATTAVVGLALFSVLAGAGTSYAYWTASTATTVSATTGDVDVTVGGFAAGTIQNHVTQSVGYVTVTNTTLQNASSTTPTALTLQVKRDTGDAGFAAAASVVVWPAAGNSSANCTLSATATGGLSGNWSTGVTLTGTLAKGASAVYCVRTTVDPAGAGAAGGTTSFAAKVQATLAVQNFTGSASSTSPMSTAFIYPLGSTVTGTSLRVHVGSLATGLCLDVSGNGGNGGAVIPWGCHTNTNQQWQFAASGSYVNITPQHNTGVRLAATSTANGAAVLVVSTSTGSQLQDWQLQTTGTGQFQLVNRASGYCLTSGSTSGQQDVAMTVAPCDGSLAQRFLPRLRSIACAVNSAWDWWNGYRTLQLSWTSTTGTRTFIVDGAQVAPTTNGATGITLRVDQNAYAAGSTHSYTVLQGGLVVAAGSFTVDGSGWLSSCGVS